jgi:hypothetical protein
LKLLHDSGDWGIKENSRGGEFRYDIFYAFVRYGVNATRFPHPA